MRNFWTIPSISGFSKLSNQNSNLQLLPTKTSLTSNYKIAFIKTPFTIQFIHKKIILKSLLYGCQSFPGLYLCPIATFLSLLFTATCLSFFPYSLSFSPPHHNKILRIAVIVIFLCLRLNLFFF